MHWTFAAAVAVIAAIYFLAEIHRDIRRIRHAVDMLARREAGRIDGPPRED